MVLPRQNIECSAHLLSKSHLLPGLPQLVMALVAGDFRRRDVPLWGHLFPTGDMLE